MWPPGLQRTYLINWDVKREEKKEKNCRKKPNKQQEGEI
jgi:hypothetical protein